MESFQQYNVPSYAPTSKAINVGYDVWKKLDDIRLSRKANPCEACGNTGKITMRTIAEEILVLGLAEMERIDDDRTKQVMKPKKKMSRRKKT